MTTNPFTRTKRVLCELTLKKQAERSPRIITLWAPYIVLSIATIYFLGLLDQAFEYAISSGDTPTFLQQIRTFHLTKNSAHEGMRRPIFSLLLVTAGLFHDGQKVVYLAHAALFFCSILIALWFTGFFAKNIILRTIFGLVFLAIEVFSMRVFFMGKFILADALYHHLIFIGALLILGGWFSQRSLILLAGACILALGSFTKPTGILILPLWVGICALIARSGAIRKWIVCLAIMIILSLNTLWQMRIAALGGYDYDFRLGDLLLAKTLQLTEESDILFAREEDNRYFHRFIRDVASQPNRGMNYNTFIYTLRGYRHPTLEPKDFTSFLLTEKDKSLDASSKTIRATYNRIAIALALKIILQHPQEYWGKFLTDYSAKFSSIRECGLRTPDYSLAKNLYNIVSIEAYDLFPEIRFLYIERPFEPSINRQAEGAMLFLLCNAIRQYNAPQAIFHFIWGAAAHFIAFGCIILLSFRRKFSLQSIDVRRLITILCLFLTVVSQNVPMTLIHETDPRLDAVGDLPLNFAYLTLLFMIFERVRTTRASHLSPCRKSRFFRV